MKSSSIILSVLALAAALACSRSKAIDTQRAVPKPSTSIGNTASLAEVPVKEDFEEKAQNVIDEVNLRDQLSQLEQEVAQDEKSDR